MIFFNQQPAPGSDPVNQKERKPINEAGDDWQPGAGKPKYGKENKTMWIWIISIWIAAVIIGLIFLRGATRRDPPTLPGIDDIEP